MDMNDEGIGRKRFFNIMQRTAQTLLREVNTANSKYKGTGAGDAVKNRF